MNITDIKHKQYHLVLSGWWAKGFMHIWVLQALHEQNIQIASVSWSSMWSLIWLFVAAGFSPLEIRGIFIENSVSDLLTFNLSLVSLFNLKKVQEVVDKYIKANTFEELKLPFTVCATNLDLWAAEYFSHWAIIETVFASCSVPFFFNPIEISWFHYVDGGVTDNFPVSVAKDLPIIGSHCNPYDAPKSYWVRTVLEKSIELLVNNNLTRQIDHCDLFIEPPLMRQYSPFDFSDAKKMMDIGYEYTMSLFEGVVQE